LDKNAFMSIEAAEARWPKLLSLAVHEFRTPASVVGGYLRMLQRDHESPLSDRQRKMVEEAEKSCARIVALITEMSEITKRDGGTAVVKSETFDLFRIVQEVADSVHEGQDREVRLEVRGTESGAEMTGDLTRLRAAFSAFFRAILREQPAACTVVAERRLVRRGDVTAAVIVVAPEEAVQGAYESSRAPFEEKRGGLGLSLPLARRAVERHGGQLWSPAADADANGTAKARAVIVSLPLPEHNR